jgi:hypothetical protein
MSNSLEINLFDPQRSFYAKNRQKFNRRPVNILLSSHLPISLTLHESQSHSFRTMQHSSKMANFLRTETSEQVML